MIVPVPNRLTALEEWDDLTLLAACAWGEARGEPEAGQIAVCSSIMNRVRHPGWWGTTVATVILRDANGDHVPEQFSCFRPVRLGGELEKVRDPLNHGSPAEWTACFRVAAGILFGYVDRSASQITELATHYLARTLKPRPSWAGHLFLLGEIGGHVFFCDAADVPRPNPGT